jgi:hypothetical protein
MSFSANMILAIVRIGSLGYFLRYCLAILPVALILFIG